MMRTLFFLFALTSPLYGSPIDIDDSKIVLSTKRLVFDNYPNAHNPSIIKTDGGFLLIFRYLPDLYNAHWISEIGIVLLNEELEPLAPPQTLNTRPKFSKTPSQSEDARIFSYKGRLFLIYNDNLDTVATLTWERRDMYISELFCEEGRFTLSPPLKLVYEEKYDQVMWQKNWVPFEWQGKLFMTYTINPHEILLPNFMNGSCYHCYDTWATLKWEWGSLRGSAPPQLVDGEYLSFFHSSAFVATKASWDMHLWHYFMGAYTFSSNPPFALTKISPKPIVGEGFYTLSGCNKRVIFPGGFAISGPFIYVAYGKDDSEIWIATLDKDALMRSLVPIKK